jgi:hypothetical protein
MDKVRRRRSLITAGVLATARSGSRAQLQPGMRRSGLPRRRIFVFPALVLMLVSIAVGSRSGHTQGIVESPIALVGKWSGSERTPDGATVTVELVLTQNMKFTGSSAVNGKVFWTYGGTWEVNGDTLTWRYEFSSRPLPESAKSDIDDIAALDAERLVLLSRVNGKRNVFLRVR